MKQSTTFALSALFAIVSAVPLQKRQQVTTTIIEDVTSTVDVYTTVFVQPGDPRLNQVQQTTVQTTIATPAGTTTLAQSPSTPPSNPAPVVEQQKQALPVVQAPAPTTTPTVTPSSTPPPPPPASTTAAVVQPIVEAPAPIQQQAAPALVSNPSTSGSSSGSSAPSGGKSCKDGGKCVADHVTTFDGTSGKGACGYVSTSVTMNYVALAVGMLCYWISNPSSISPPSGHLLTSGRHDG